MNILVLFSFFFLIFGGKVHNNAIDGQKQNSECLAVLKFTEVCILKVWASAFCRAKLI